ncbi:uncharacterized protein [Porites lutea]|uniref:uncharacterized protein n=1 Tax=Porites lutea TaxID=51062 RepID=UPI003CC5FE0B
MAASSEREYRKLLTDSLLSEEVSNSYTLDEFKDFFPRKYRDHQDVNVLYEAYQTKRKLIRDRVVMNVRMHCRKRKQQGRMMPNNKYEDEIKEMEAKEEILQEEIDTMEKDMEQVQEKIASCTDNLDKKKPFCGLQTADFKAGKETRKSRSRSDR